MNESEIRDKLDQLKAQIMTEEDPDIILELLDRYVKLMKELE